MLIADIKQNILRAINPLYFSLDSEERAKFIEMCEENVLDRVSASLYKSYYESNEEMKMYSTGITAKRCLKVGYLEYIGQGKYMVTLDGYRKACEILNIS